MSKVTQIQRALLDMGGGEFQKLADAYLAEKEFGRINSIGSVVAANKVRKGTPDTLIATPEGYYIFTEHTTQQAGLLDKMMDDLNKCFDESKTGVPVGKIERVIFCFTGKLDSAEEYQLAEACQEKGVNLDLFGIDTIAFDLYRQYPALARDFLGVPIDTGQIVPPERFVSLHNSNKLATRLDFGFHFREEELSHLLAVLENERLVILTGQAGIGKSRLALESCKIFREAHPKYEVLCVFGRNRDLWEDLQAWFTKPGHFLILVDDANRVSRFEYIVDVIQHQRLDQRIKVVATVRDYALTKIQEAARPLGVYSEVELVPFTDEQIKKLITDEYGIVNHHYLERIADIALGNPRLAVMAAEVAKDSPLSSIHDVSALYDIYFSSIRKDLSGEGADPGSADLLRVAAIVSFFTAVDRTNRDMMSAIEVAFGISPVAFWETAGRLHDMELLDMHGDEVVKVADQVLGTYLFYLAVFKEGLLDFGALLTHFFPRLRHRLIDSITPILNAFDSKLIMDVMRPHVVRIWAELEEKGNYESLFQLLDDFWFVERTKTLLWVRNRINELEPAPVEITDVTFVKSAHSPPSPSILSVLRSFAYVGRDEVRIALQLLSLYLIKRPAEAPLILKLLIDDYGFKPDSYLRQFAVQRAVADELWGHAESGDPIFLRIFLTVASDYLGTHFETHRMRNALVVEFKRFDLPATLDLAALRGTIWQRLFALCKQEGMRDDVLEVIRHYNKPSDRLTNSEVVRSDAEHILPFLESVLDPSSYLHCTVMYDYLDLLEMHGGKVTKGLRDRFRNDTYALATILLPEWGRRQRLGLSYEEYEQYRLDSLKEHTRSYTLSDYEHFFERCIEIRESHAESFNEHQLHWGVVTVLLSLADRDADLYSQVLERYLVLKDPLRLNGCVLVRKLVEQRGRDDALQLLAESDYPTKKKWLFHVHEVLPVDDVDEGMLTHLYGLYEAAESSDLPHRLDYLLKYLPLDARVVARVVSKVIEKAEDEPSFAYTLTLLYNPYTEVAKRLIELFAEDLDLLQQAYLIVDATQDHSDFDGQLFDRLLNLNPAFITKYIAWKYENSEHGRLSSHDDHRDYSFIWSRPDHEEIMDKLVESLYAPQLDRFTYIEPYLKRFFLTRGDDREPEGVERERQDTYLIRLINQRSEDVDFMEYLFGVIAHFPPHRRGQFIKRFVQLNSNFEAFTRLPLESSIWFWSSSEVPVLQGRKDYWESLLPIMNTVDLLPHKQYVEHQIRRLQDQIEREKKSDFIGD